MIGRWLDAWIPRTLKLLGVAGFGLSLILAAEGRFDPALFGGCLMAGSGGYVGDALVTLKRPPGKAE